MHSLLQEWRGYCVELKGERQFSLMSSDGRVTKLPGIIVQNNISEWDDNSLGNEAKIIKGSKLSQLPHHQDRHTKKKKKENRSENVTSVTFMDLWGGLEVLYFFFLTKSQGFWKTGCSLCPPTSAPPPSHLLGVLPIELSFPKKDKHPEGTSDPTPEGGCVQSGKWPLRPVWFSKRQYPRFQISLSEHSFKTVTFLSFLPAMGAQISEINYKLWPSDFHSRIH